MELPWRTPIVNARWRWLRPAGYALILLLLIAPLIQFQRGTMKYLELAREAERTAALTPQEAAEAGKDHKGAIGRWRSDIRHFWQGENIYLGVVPEGVYIPPLDHAPGEGWAVKHPNMAFVVLLLTPFAYLPVPVMALLFNL